MNYFLLSLLFVCMLSGQLTAWNIPDNSDARRTMAHIMHAPIFEVDARLGRIIEDDLSMALVKFEIERNGEKLYFIFINERQGSFPIVGAGNVIIRKNVADGHIEQVKVYLDDNGALVLRAVPHGRRSLLELSLYDDVLYSGISVSMEIEQLIESDVDDILSLSSGRIPWDKLSPPENAVAFAELVEVLERLREVLPTLPDADDGAMDENGNLVRIETLKTNELPGFNCSGFAKFVGDGLYYRYDGEYMSIAKLKIKHLTLRGTDVSMEFEDERDPYFGLDWTRNIAISLLSRKYHFELHPEAADVRNTPFYQYTEDIGYRVSELVQVLYLQSISNPGHLYLGSVNGEFGSNPTLWQHYHVVVLFPYFDKSGGFRIAVLERNAESSIDSLKRRYGDQYIHLVSVESVADYDPPEIRVVH